ncbi:MAG TPA: aminotransferase class V-fold PLP-dependent enzyme [Steroidobacteraceae bacterium]|jgi:glutamate/tyrosine decarboxylase-like PLP-dependent enzyme|nr:aminotransferase class V-fold PLP-dependent enzyme [Steroidobacteraceae bacterium]
MSALDLSPEEFQSLAARVTDLAARFLTALPTLPSFPDVSGQQTRERFGEPLPEHGLKGAALDGLEDVVAMIRPPSPRFYGYVLGSGDPVAALADMLASVLNQNVTAWRSSPAAVTIERQVIEWLATAVGCGGFAGSLCSGASLANLMALAMAREAKLPGAARGARAIVYASSEVHMSIPKAVALLGLGRENLHLIPVDGAWRMDVRELRAAIEKDVAAGGKPIAVIANAGTVTTGAIDPLESIAAVCRQNDLWLHVDGAYGALAAIAAPERLRGLALADSLSLDPHKWLYQPVDCSTLLYRNAAAARAAFSNTGEYARTFASDPLEAFAFFDESIELSRRFRALKLWLSLRYHGAEAFRTAIRADLRHASDLARMVGDATELELLAPVELSAVCFRYRGTAAAADLDRLNGAILKRLIERGRIYLSNASINGCFALRACFVNHRTTDADAAGIVPEVLAASRDVLG